MAVSKLIIPHNSCSVVSNILRIFSGSANARSVASNALIIMGVLLLALSVSILFAQEGLFPLVRTGSFVAAPGLCGLSVAFCP